MKRPKIKLIGEDGNAFVIMGKVVSVLRSSGKKSLIEKFKKEAMLGDYDNLLRVTMKYVDIE